MKTDRPDDIILHSVALLSEQSEAERAMLPHGAGHFPSVDVLREIVRLVKCAVFPDFFDKQRNNDAMRAHFIGVAVEQLHNLLYTEIGHALRFDSAGIGDADSEGDSLATRFVGLLPEIKRLLYTDIEAIRANDPAVCNYAEIILCYPVVTAMVHYRVAHALLGLGVPLLPRMLTEAAHTLTGIDIHPGATIGEYFAIDHGTGVVIGETCVIGRHVTLYQGVTLGARNFAYDPAGHPINIPRHPELGDNVTVYANATVLGRITVGHDSVIGGNVWLTESVPPHSRILQHVNKQ